MMIDNSVLNVELYGETIGHIIRLADERLVFEFDERYIENENRPTLSLSFRNNDGELLKGLRPTRTHLPPFFSNLLPEGFMRRYLAKQAGVNPEREFFLLHQLGYDLAGAITVRDAKTIPVPSTNQTKLFDSSGGRLRFSLAGVQLKFSASQNSDSDFTVPTEGAGGSWILKLASENFPQVPENEFSMMYLAKLVGIDVPEIKLLEASQVDNLPIRSKQKIFAVKRFDRVEQALVHIEDFAQVFGLYPADKYGKASYRNILNVLSAETTDEDISEFIKRLTFSVLIGNSDMHVKNWSLIYHDKVTASLAPAYDFVSTIPYIPDPGLALKVSKSKRFDHFNFKELRDLAVKARVSEKLVVESAAQTVEVFMQHWLAEKANLPMSESVRAVIDKHVHDLPLLGESSG